MNPDEIDRSGEVPPEVIAELGRMGAFGIKVPTQYGGLGLSQTNYSRAAMLLGSYDANLTALVSAHRSIGAAAAADPFRHGRAEEEVPAACREG